MPQVGTRFARPALYDLFNRSHHAEVLISIPSVLIILSACLYTVLALGPLAYVFIFPFIILLIIANTQMALSLLIASIYFQSLLIAFVMPAGTNVTSFQSAQAFSIVVLASLAVLALPSILNNLSGIPPILRKLVWYAIIVSFIVIAFSMYGLTKSSSASVGGYIRLYFMLTLGIFIGIAYARRINIYAFYSICIYMSIFSVILGFVEVIFSKSYYDFWGIVDYVNLKYQGEVHLRNSGDLMKLATRSFLNLSGLYSLDIEFVRPYGSTIHSISYSYSIAFGAAMAIVLRRWLAFALFAPALLFVGSKGALVLVLTMLMVHVVSKSKSNATLFWIYGAWITIYVSITLIYGQLTSDYHYLGLKGGLSGFINQPLGHGVGIGGNLSDLGRSDAKDFQAFTLKGGADFALESGIGVILYQMGVLGFSFLYLWFKIGGNLARHTEKFVVASEERRTCLLVSYGFQTLLIGSLFQEETLSPAALGIWTILTTLVLTRASKYAHARHATQITPATQLSIPPKFLEIARG